MLPPHRSSHLGRPLRGRSPFAAVLESSPARRDPFRIDLADEPAQRDDRHAAWAEAKRRVTADPDLKTVVLNRDTGAILWQSDPDIPPRYQVVTADRPFVHAIDHAEFPVAVLSEHKEKDGAWTAFHDAVAASTDDLVFIFDISGPRRRVIANSDDFDHL